MKQYPFLKGRTGTVVFGGFLFLMLLLARDSMFTHAIVGFVPAQLMMLGILGLFGLGFLICNRKSLKEIFLDRRMILFAVSAVVILIPMLVKRDWQLMYFSILLGSFLAIFLTYFTTKEAVARYYIVFMAVLGLYSILATYILRHFLVGIVPTFQNDNGILFHNFGLSVVSDTFVKNRNFGIFREPGVYQYFVILAMFLNNYCVVWDKGWKYWGLNIALAATMVSTFATGGLIEMALLVFVVFFEKKMYKDRRLLAIAIVCVVLVLIFLGICILQRNQIYWELYSALIAKFSPSEDSYSERWDAIFTDTKFFFANPLVGEKISTVLHAVENNTTSTMVMLAMFGILGGALHVVSWLALIWKWDRAIWANLILCFLMFFSFNTQNITADLFLWLFPMMALTERTLPYLTCPEAKE